jgi:hypothetical protein
MKNRFSDPELFLLKNWSDAQLLEQSMGKIREEYETVFGEVLDAVQERHKELDSRAELDRWGVGIGKHTWPSIYPRWPTGLYFDNIALENLMLEDEKVPEAYIWLEPLPELQVDMQRAELKLRVGAEKILSGREFEVGSGKNGKNVCLEYRLPESRSKLLESLLKDKGEEFIELMVEHFEALAGFIPVRDDIFADAKRGS